METGRIEYLNCVNEQTCVKLNYDLSTRERCVKFALDMEGNVVLVGELDNNYIDWLSKTKVDDLETNAAVFSCIAQKNHQYVSHEYKALAQLGITWKEYTDYYMGSLKRVKDGERMIWETPFGHYYADDKDAGKYFAGDLKRFPKDLKYKCELREGDGSYLRQMEYYRALIEKFDVMSYPREAAPLRDVLEAEGYLRLSDNTTLRNTYIACMRELSELYNRYMTAVR